MHILITAGGASEPIDAVRKITNTSTGRLASIIHNTWVSYAQDNHLDLTIHYVVATPAVMPMENEHTILYKVSDTFSVQSTIRNILKNNTIDIMIHLMAISDYYVSNVLTTKQLAESLYGFINIYDKKDQLLDPKIIENFLTNGINQQLKRRHKISSKDDLFIQLSQTPKIISEIKEYSPATKLIGFKLLDQVSEEELIDVATKQSYSNGCEFVVANDLSQISRDYHHAILVKDGKVIDRCTTKEDIAKAIIKELSK